MDIVLRPRCLAIGRNEIADSANPDDVAGLARTSIGLVGADGFEPSFPV
jgi:hypothetical protein